MSRFAPSVFIKIEFHNFPAASGINRHFSPAEAGLDTSHFFLILQFSARFEQNFIPKSLNIWYV